MYWYVMTESTCPQRRVLIVEDDAELARLIAQELSVGGFQAHIAGNGRQALEYLRRHDIALVLLDLMLPGEDGLELCKQLRAIDPPPGIIMVTARNELADKVTGLELGADDYVVKPFESRELLARCKAVIRRHAAPPPRQDARQAAPARYHFLGWQLDLGARQLYSPQGVTVSLPNSDFHVLVALLEAPNKVLSRALLLRRAFSRNLTYEDRAVDVCISRLRHHLEQDRSRPALVHTVRNEGYVLRLDPASLRTE